MRYGVGQARKRACSAWGGDSLPPAGWGGRDGMGRATRRRLFEMHRFKFFLRAMWPDPFVNFVTAPVLTSKFTT